MSHIMYLIEKEELLDLLTAWYQSDCKAVYEIVDWPREEQVIEYKKEWCRENCVEYNEALLFRDIAEHELKNYEETEVEW